MNAQAIAASQQDANRINAEQVAQAQAYAAAYQASQEETK